MIKADFLIAQILIEMHPPIKLNIFLLYGTIFHFFLKLNLAEGVASIFVDSFGTLHSLEKLSYWANKEEDLFHIFSKRLTAIDEEINLISKYITDYEVSSERALSEAIEKRDEDNWTIIASSAVLSHMMTHRFATTLDELRTLLHSTDYRDTEGELKKLLEIQTPPGDSSQWPNSDDLLISHFAIMHIQEAHFFKPENILFGTTFNTTFGGMFKAIHCAHIGMFLLERKQHARAIEWLELTYNLLEEDEDDDDSISKEVVTNMLNLAVQQHNWNMQPDFVDYSVWSKSFSRSTLPHQPRHPSKFFYGKEYHYYLNSKKYMQAEHSLPNMIALCNDEEFMPEEVRSKLKCYRFHGGDPYYLINPLNAEQISESPFVVQYYNVLSENLMKEYYESRGELRLSTVAHRNFTGKLDSLSDSRSSAGTVLSPDYGLKIWELTNRLTGLVEMELTQAVEYVYGRLYWNHLDTFTSKMDSLSDFLTSSLDLIGDRLATVLYYVDVPVEGGSTPFCDLGVSVYPVRGSAVFWYNMFKNGTVRTDVSHGACPVLAGHKTILNQWIPYNANFQTFKCSLNQFE